MKNTHSSSISVEGLLLLVILMAGIVGAMYMMRQQAQQPTFASPNQENPAMVVIEASQDAAYQDAAAY